MEVENMRKHFWRLKEGEKGKNFDKKVNSLTRYKIGGTRVESSWDLFFSFTFFFCKPIPSSTRPSAFGLRPSASLRSKKLKKEKLVVGYIKRDSFIKFIFSGLCFSWEREDITKLGVIECLVLRESSLISDLDDNVICFFRNTSVACFNRFASLGDKILVRFCKT